MEYECYDDRGRSQGRAIIELVEWEDMARGLFLAVHLVASDEYYEYYAQDRLNDGKGVYHICGDERRGCVVRLGRQDRRELVHLEKWRLMSPVLMMVGGKLYTCSRGAGARPASCSQAPWWGRGRWADRFG